MTDDELNLIAMRMKFTWADIYKAFCDGADEVMKNYPVKRKIIRRSADAYCKLILLNKINP